MDFIIKDINDKEHGPIDLDTLKKWIDEDRVTKDTPVRNSLIPRWKTAADFDSVQENLQEQETRLEQQSDAIAKSVSAVSSVKSFFKKKVSKEKTSFAHKHEAENAEAGSRIWAFVFDVALLSLLVFLPLFIISNYYASSIAATETDSSVKELPLKDNLYPDAGKVRIKDENPVTEDQTQSLPPGKNAPAATPSGDKKPAPAVNSKAPVQPPAKDGKAKATPAQTQSLPPGGVVAQAATNPELPAAPPVPEKKAPPPTIDNLRATNPPSTKACASAGYETGSIWKDASSGIKYVCLSPAENSARWLDVNKLNHIYTIAAAVAIPIIILYYGITLGYYAQTFGMWFWGIFITGRKLNEVYFFRSFIFTILMIVLGIISPLMVYIFGRAPHDLLAGVRIINVAGKTPD